MDQGNASRPADRVERQPSSAQSQAARQSSGSNRPSLLKVTDSPKAAGGSGKKLDHKKTQLLGAAMNAIHDQDAKDLTKEGIRPWMNKNGDIIWSPHRVALAKLVLHQWFDSFMGCVIVGNLILIILEADEEAICYPTYYHNPYDCPHHSSNQPWTVVSNWIFLSVYAVEAILKIYALRLLYFRNRFNWLDFFVVTAGLLSEILGLMMTTSTPSGIAFLRIFRIARLTRTLRFLFSIHELYMLIVGLGSSMRAIFFGVIMLGGMLMVWSIILVEFVHPKNSTLPYEDCERCGRGFQDVWSSTLTIFQHIVAGDEWGAISVPLIEAEPAFGIILGLIVVTVSLGAMNLILAVIVESAAEAREADWPKKIKTKQQQMECQKEKFLALCKDMDEDESGTISLQEMYSAWDKDENFRNMMAYIDVRKEELKTIFEIMDTDSTGEVSYLDFVEQFYHVRTYDMRMMLAALKLDVEELATKFESNKEYGAETLAKRTEEHAFLLAHHSRLLESIDTRVGRLLSEKASNGTENKARGFNCTDHESDMSQPEAEDSQDWGKKLPTSQRMDLTRDLGQLHKHVESLSAMRSDILRRLEAQEATLLQQTQRLANVRRLLPQAQASAGEELDRMRRAEEQLLRLQQHVDKRLSTIMKEFDRRVNEEAEALASGGKILEALARNLNSPGLTLEAPAAHSLAGGGSANGAPSAWRSPGRSGSARSARGVSAPAVPKLPTSEMGLCQCNGTEIPRRFVISK